MTSRSAFSWKRNPLLRRALVWVLVAGVAAGVPAYAAPRAAAEVGSHAGGSSAPRSLPPEVIASASTAPGSLVRDGDGIHVDRVGVPTELRSTGVPGAVYRVRIDGAFPPRALRYVVTAGGHAVAYGFPSARLDALVAITADPSVVTEPIIVRYGARLVEPVPERTTTGAVTAHGTTSSRRGFGPLDVVQGAYDLGDEVFHPPGIDGKVELVGDVHYPRGLPDGPYPLVLFLHGNHSSCYRGTQAGYTWPCPDGWKPLPNEEGYDYIAERLASYGFVVVSVSGNGVNVLGNQVADTGMRQRGELLERHLELWRRWSTMGGGPFGSKFVGQVDLNRTGTMGHSRGGEGAVWQVIVDRERPDPFGIDAILPLAPVDFTRETVNDVPMAVMLPYCDGDVSDLQGVHFFDDARYLVPGDPTPKQAVTVFGANHNFFNTVWTPASGYPGSFDDGMPRCEGRLRAVEQRRVGAAYIVSFFRRYVGGDRSQDQIWTGARRAPGIAPAKVLTSYLAPDTPSRRLDLDRFDDPDSLSVNQLGGGVTATAMSTYEWCADTFAVPCVTDRYAFNDIHLPGLSRGVLGWSGSGASVRFGLPDGSGNVAAFDALQLRTALDPGSDSDDVERQNLVVTLLDGSGDRASVAASSVGDDALAYPSRIRSLQGHVIMQQLRFPLGAFAGVDLSDIRAVTLRFSRTDAGVIHVADLAFASGAR